MEKQIKINLADFQINTGKRTRKKREDDPQAQPPIRVKQPYKIKDHNKTTKKSTLLRFLRKQQENNYRKLMESAGAVLHVPGSLEEEPSQDIDQALEYLMNITDKTQEQEQQQMQQQQQQQQQVQVQPPHTITSSRTTPYVTQDIPIAPKPSPRPSVPNHTLRRHHDPSMMARALGGTVPTDENVSLTFPTDNSPAMKLAPAPLYGCLKGGSLPTWKQHQRNLGGDHAPTVYPSSHTIHSPAPPNTFQEKYLLNSGGNVAPAGQATDPSKVRMKYVRQKRTNRRTFKVGKSKVYPKIGVLISNRTLRKDISSKSQLLKQTPIHEVRQYLVKRGLIKVGTTAPNEILRKMYESSKMMCGELYNHNTETLLHNFINDREH